MLTEASVLPLLPYFWKLQLPGSHVDPLNSIVLGSLREDKHLTN